MFGFIADILTSVTSILFPVFASYKALRTSDPANLAPWLMYWTTLSLFLVVENQLYFILYWIPFYPWLRLGIHLYLVLPGQQGSVFIYKEHIHPFLEEHERQIDQMISDAHAKAKAAGMDAVKRAIEYIRVQVLGQAPRDPTPPPSRNVSYSSYLINRFTMPSAREGLPAAGATDIFSMLGKVLNQSTYPDSTSREQKVEDLSASGNLIPDSLVGKERDEFIATRRDQLRTVLQFFDTQAFRSVPAEEAPVPQPPTPPAGSSLPRRTSGRKSWFDAGASSMHHSRSESEFEDLAYEPMPMPDPEDFAPKKRAGSGGGGISNWIWGNYGEKDSVVDPKKED